jgi:hypothetical protein
MHVLTKPYILEQYMSLDLSSVDALIQHLDTSKGAFWNGPEDITPDRALAVEFIVTNAAGESILCNSMTVANFHHLVSQIGKLDPEQSHPCTVLNRIWEAVKGVKLIGDPSQVKGFVVYLLENTIAVSVTDMDGDTTTASVTCGIATRVMMLRAFCEIDEALHQGFHTWVGKAEIIYDGVTDGGTIHINGIQQVVTEAPAAEVIEEKAIPVPRKRASKAAPVPAPAVREPSIKKRAVKK